MVRLRSNTQKKTSQIQPKSNRRASRSKNRNAKPNIKKQQPSKTNKKITTRKQNKAKSKGKKRDSQNALELNAQRQENTTGKRYQRRTKGKRRGHKNQENLNIPADVNSGQINAQTNNNEHVNRPIIMHPNNSVQQEINSQQNRAPNQYGPLRTSQHDQSRLKRTKIIIENVQAEKRNLRSGGALKEQNEL